MFHVLNLDFISRLMHNNLRKTLLIVANVAFNKELKGNDRVSTHIIFIDIELKYLSSVKEF